MPFDWSKRTTLTQDDRGEGEVCPPYRIEVAGSEWLKNNKNVWWGEWDSIANTIKTRHWGITKNIRTICRGRYRKVNQSIALEGRTEFHMQLWLKVVPQVLEISKSQTILLQQHLGYPRDAKHIPCWCLLVAEDTYC